MGNQTVQKINPCSEKTYDDSKSSLNKSHLKISQTIKFQRTKSQTITTSVPKMLNLQTAKSLTPQNQQCFSTQASYSKNEQIKISLTSSFSLTLDQESPVCKKNDNQAFKPKIKKIFIFDWDDTLFFSSHLRQQKCSTKNLKVEDSILKKFDQNVNKILEACLKVGEVYIVTNSRDGWVKHSSSLFLPKTLQTIFKNSKVKVISSRPTMEEFYLCTAALKWKYTAFKNILQELIPKQKGQLFEQNDLHVICVGDSQQQIDATNEIYEEYHQHFRNLFIKTIKLQDFPDIEDLIEQQELFYQKLQMIANINKKLVIKLKRSKKAKTEISN